MYRSIGWYYFFIKTEPSFVYHFIRCVDNHQILKLSSGCGCVCGSGGGGAGFDSFAKFEVVLGI